MIEKEIHILENYTDNISKTIIWQGNLLGITCNIYLSAKGDCLNDIGSSPRLHRPCVEKSERSPN